MSKENLQLNRDLEIEIIEDIRKFTENRNVEKADLKGWDARILKFQGIFMAQKTEYDERTAFIQKTISYFDTEIVKKQKLLIETKVIIAKLKKAGHGKDQCEFCHRWFVDINKHHDNCKKKKKADKENPPVDPIPPVDDDPKPEDEIDGELASKKALDDMRKKYAADFKKLKEKYQKKNEKPGE